MIKTKNYSDGFQKTIGFAGALLQIGLLLSDYAEPGVFRLGPVYLAFALIFLTSIRFASLGVAQALLFFALAGLQTASSLNPFYGLGYAGIATLILFRRGWFVRNAFEKALFAAVAGILLLAAPMALSGKSLIAQAPVILSSAIYAILVFGLAKGRFLSALAPKKRLLRLSDYKLNQRERKYVLSRLTGMSVKEIASDDAAAVSTVRNNLSRAYRKLGVVGGAELMALGARYRVE